MRSEELTPDEVDHLIIGKVELNPPPIPEVLKSFLQESVWAACKGLEQLPIFAGFC